MIIPFFLPIINHHLTIIKPHEWNWMAQFSTPWGPSTVFWWPAGPAGPRPPALSTAPEHRDVARPWPAWWSNGRHRSPGTGPGFVGKRWVLPYENQMKSIETWGLDGFTIGFTRWNPLKSDQLGENWPKKIDLKLVSHCLTFCFS